MPQNPREFALQIGGQFRVALRRVGGAELGEDSGGRRGGGGPRSRKRIEQRLGPPQREERPQDRPVDARGGNLRRGAGEEAAEQGQRGRGRQRGEADPRQLITRTDGHAGVGPRTPVDAERRQAQALALVGQRVERGVGRRVVRLAR